MQITDYRSFPRDPPQLASDSYRYYRALGWLERTAGDRLPGSSWLDLGCHSGALLRVVSRYFGSGAIGCDVYPETDKTSRVYECFKLTENEDWTYRQRDVSQGLSGLGRFRVISALEVIEHLVDTDKFLSEVNEHLEPGGYLLLTTPNINSLHNRIGVPLGKYPNGIEYRNVIHHVRLYNVPTLASHLAEHGYEVVAIKGVQMLPRRWIDRSPIAQSASEFVADLLPSLAPNILAVARKRHGGG